MIVDDTTFAKDESSVTNKDFNSVDLTNIEVLLKIHEDTLQKQLEAKKSLEEERELNRRLLKELQLRDQEQEILRRIVE